MADKTRKFYGTGRRKSSSARVTLIPGNGKITLNGRAGNNKIVHFEADGVSIGDFVNVKINKVMSLKTPEAGDEIIIYADGRKKRLADIFAEAKIPREHRSMYPVLAAGKEILWVPGIRGSEGYRVTKETKQVLIATIDGGNENGT